MTRGRRIRITIGLAMFLLGLITLVLGPELTRIGMALFDSPTTSSQAHLEASNRVHVVQMIVAFTGMGVAAISFLWVFVEWACWFIGPRERAAKVEA